jgi:hypothetical protein
VQSLDHIPSEFVELLSRVEALSRQSWISVSDEGAQ